jgi:hypothetical protein
VATLKNGIRHLEHPDKYWERVAKRSEQRERRDNGDEKQQTN